MDWKFKKNAKAQGSSDGFWYDITLGGYINLEEVLSDKEQINKLNKALEIVKSFEEALENNGLIEEF